LDLKRSEAIGLSVASLVCALVPPREARAERAWPADVEGMRSVITSFDRRFGIVDGAGIMVMRDGKTSLHMPIPRPPDDQFAWTIVPAAADPRDPVVGARIPGDEIIAVAASAKPVWLFRKPSRNLYLFRFSPLERIGETRAVNGVHDAIGMYLFGPLRLVRADLSEVAVAW
jgi:hypothetical protein